MKMEGVNLVMAEDGEEEVGEGGNQPREMLLMKKG